MNIGKVVIIVLVVLVLYVMHKYQNNILLFLKSSLHTPEQTPQPITKKENKKEKKVRIKDKDINMDNISQVSIGSLEDNTIDPYQADPMLNSMESNNTISSLLDG